MLSVKEKEQIISDLVKKHISDLNSGRLSSWDLFLKYLDIIKGGKG